MTPCFEVRVSGTDLRAYFRDYKSAAKYAEKAAIANMRNVEIYQQISICIPDPRVIWTGAAPQEEEDI